MIDFNQFLKNWSGLLDKLLTYLDKFFSFFTFLNIFGVLSAASPFA